MTIITAVRQIQLPLLALLLLGGCAAKLVRAVRTRSLGAGLGPTELFPRRLRRPAAVAVCGTELGLAAGLLITADRAGLNGPAEAVRLATALFFVVALFGLVELREHRPDLGCGCFGDLSARPVSVRSIARAGVLAAAALATVGLAPVHLPPPGPRAAVALSLLLAELLLVALLSPEAGETLMRLGYTEPCELRAADPQRALAALHRSRAWRRQAALAGTGTPADMWRELCWWYVVYPAQTPAPGAALVFAVQVKQHWPTIRAALTGPGMPGWPQPGDTGTAGVGSANRSAAF
jgi:hypothetical protein